MASKASTDAAAAKNTGFVKSYFRNGILGNLKILIIITALNLLSFPVALATLTFDMYQYQKAQHAASEYYYYYSGNSEWFMVLAVLFTGAAVLSGIIIALNNFSYLYKKQNVDMYLSLPLKNSQRFLCDYFSGLVCYILPFLLSGILTLTISFASMALVTDMAKPIEGDIYLPGLIIRCYLGGAVIMIMLYTLTVLVSTICGSLFETVFYTVVINGLIPGVIAIVVLVLFGNAFGLVYWDYIIPPLSKTSPLGALIGFVMYAEDFDDAYVLSVSFIAGYCLILLVVSALYAAVAYLLYRRRKAEDVSKPFVYNIFYYAIMACIMLSLSAFIVVEDDFAVPLIIFMAVVYLVFEVINKRGFKKFKYSLLRCVITIVACIGISMVCSATNGFGISYRVPDANSVKSVSITYMGPEDIVFTYTDTSINKSNSITLSDRETIENVITAHKNTIDKYDNYGDYNDRWYNYYWYDQETRHVVLTYHLKNGTSFTRQYDMTVDELYYLNYVCLDSDYEKEVRRILEQQMARSYEIYVSGYSSSGQQRIYRDDDEAFYKKFTKDIAAAYAKDLAGRSITEMYNELTHKSRPVAEMWIGYRQHDIYRGDKNVIEVLGEYGIDVYKLSAQNEYIYDDIELYEEIAYYE